MKKKLVLIVTALTLCAVMVVGGTLAFLTSRTETLENIFKFDSGGKDSATAVNIEIAEPKWTGGTNGQPTGTSNATTVKYNWDDKAADANGAPNGAAVEVPGSNKKLKDSAGVEHTLWGEQQPFYDTNLIDKDPTVANNTKVETYVGVAVTLPQSLEDADGNIYALTWSEFDKIAKLAFTVEGGIATAAYNHVTGDTSKLGYLPTTPNTSAAAANGWALVRQDGATRYYVYQDKLSARVEKAWQTFRAANKSVTNPLFDIVEVRFDASQATFDGGKKVKLATDVINPAYDPAIPESATNVKMLSETDNIFLALRDCSGDPTDPQFQPTAESALELDVRAFGTQAVLENDAKKDDGTVVAGKTAWNATGTISPTAGPLYALDIAFPGVFK